MLLFIKILCEKGNNLNISKDLKKIQFSLQLFKNRWQKDQPKTLNLLEIYNVSHNELSYRKRHDGRSKSPCR